MSEHTRTQATVRVLVAGGQGVTRAGLGVLLNVHPDIHVAVETSAVGDAIALARSIRPNVVLLDLWTSKMDGIEATRRLADDRFRVLVLTATDNDQAIHDALRAGALGIVPQHIHSHELAAAVRTVAAGSAWLDPDLRRSLIDSAAARPEPIPAMELAGKLTLREREILVMLALGRSVQEVSRALSLREDTVQRHVLSVMAKTRSRNRGQLIGAALSGGLIRNWAEALQVRSFYGF